MDVTQTEAIFCANDECGAELVGHRILVEPACKKEDEEGVVYDAPAQYLCQRCFRRRRFGIFQSERKARPPWLR